MGTPQRIPIAAILAAPVARTVRQVAAASVLSLPGPVEVPCPRCGAACASWWPLTGQLYRDGTRLGARCERVAVRCDCGADWQTSGRKVGRNRHNGRPLLG
jgi:hypothetical protein